MYNAYSFLDLQAVINHPSKGTYIFGGEGIGEINIEMLTEKTAHEVAADGVVMGSKIAGDNGQITINVQQTSNLHHWLLDAYNASMVSDASDWMGISARLWNVVDGAGHMCRGGSFQKLGPKGYKAQGQMVSWILMFADVKNI